MSFTSGGLLHRESLTISELYDELRDWDAVRRIVIGENRLRMRTANSSVRLYQEIASRLKLLTAGEVDILKHGSFQEQAYVLWLAVCKRYRFIYDFAAEVIREKYLRLDLALAPEEYDIFFNRKAEWRPEVESVAPATRAKQRQLLFKMLREAELLNSDGRIVPALLSPRLIDAMVDDDPAHFAVFPVSEMDVKRWTQ
ncbi:MAG: DUF1819 family protein [Caldilinea sp.]